MVFLLLVSVHFLANVTELSIRCTQVTIWNHDKGKVILMLQVRQVIRLVTSHPYLPFCRHIIPILNFISIENIFGCYLIKLYPCNNVVLGNQN